MIPILPDGAVGLDKPREWTGRAICGVTGEDVSHAKQYLLDCTWERTVWWTGLLWRSGIHVTWGIQPADYYGLPRAAFTEDQLRGMAQYWIRELNARTPYNVPKLLAMYLVEKHRRFFERLGWVPFQARGLGDICSPTVDKAIRAGGLDALPGRSEESATPGDFFASPLFDWRAA